MIKQPPYLKKGDKVAIVCPAKYLPKPIDFAIAKLKEWGLEVLIGDSVSAIHHQFAGDDTLRSNDLQKFLDDPDVKAIIGGRGGYGTIRIIDMLDFTAFETNPKWIVGFSDLTVLIFHVLARLNTQSIHGPMPYTFEDATSESLESLKKVLFGASVIYTCQSHFKNRKGEAEGILIGGNLTLLTILEGSASTPDYTDKILFLEDVGEHEYSIDRMMRMLKRSGKLENLKGLIIGALNEIEPEKISFGQTPEEIIWEIVKEYDYPVCFNFPSGHIADNRAMVIGGLAKIKVSDFQAILYGF